MHFKSDDSVDPQRDDEENHNHQYAQGQDGPNHSLPDALGGFDGVRDILYLVLHGFV